MGSSPPQRLRDCQLALAAFVFVRLDPAPSALRHPDRSRGDSSAVSRRLSPPCARTRLHKQRCDTAPNFSPPTRDACLSRMGLRIASSGIRPRTAAESPLGRLAGEVDRLWIVTRIGEKRWPARPYILASFSPTNWKRTDSRRSGSLTYSELPPVTLIKFWRESGGLPQTLPCGSLGTSAPQLSSG